jgi:hypothetical protein
VFSLCFPYLIRAACLVRVGHERACGGARGPADEGRSTARATSAVGTTARQGGAGLLPRADRTPPRLADRVAESASARSSSYLLRSSLGIMRSGLLRRAGRSRGRLARIARCACLLRASARPAARSEQQQRAAAAAGAQARPQRPQASSRATMTPRQLASVFFSTGRPITYHFSQLPSHGCVVRSTGPGALSAP